MTTPEITWKRQPSGQYVGRHGFWVYTAWRNTEAAKGRQWVLEGYPEGNPNAVQRREGIGTAKLAQQAALRTNCFHCGRWLPFGTLKIKPGMSGLGRPIWVCRDTGPCQVERDRLTGVGNANEYDVLLRQIRDAKAAVRDMETEALVLRTRALNTGTTVDEIRRIEQEVSGR